MLCWFTGPWADGSSWNAVIGPLLSRGVCVLAAPIPLTSLSVRRSFFERGASILTSDGQSVTYRADDTRLLQRKEEKAT
jgi:hypothetical protein